MTDETQILIAFTFGFLTALIPLTVHHILEYKL